MKIGSILSSKNLVDTYLLQELNLQAQQNENDSQPSTRTYTWLETGNHQTQNVNPIPHRRSNNLSQNWGVLNIRLIKTCFEISKLTHSSWDEIFSFDVPALSIVRIWLSLISHSYSLTLVMFLLMSNILRWYRVYFHPPYITVYFLHINQNPKFQFKSTKSNKSQSWDN